MRWADTRKHLEALLLSVLLIGAVALIIEFSGGTVPYPDERYRFDHYYYIAMAESPFSDEPLVHSAPRAWRVLTPFLVFLMPFDFRVGFYIVSFIGLVLACYFAYLYLRKLQFHHRYALAGIFLLALLPDAFRLNLWDYFLTDPLVLAFIAISFYLMETRRVGLLALCVLFSVLNKEILIILIPTYAVFALRHDGFTRASTLNVLTVALPGLLGYLCLRLFIPAYNDHDLMAQSYAAIQSKFVEGGFLGIARQLGGYTTGTWGILFPLAALNLGLKVSWLRSRPEWSVFLMLVYLQMLMSADIGRLLVLAFPVMLPLALHTLRFLHTNLNRLQFWSLVALMCLLHIIFALHDDIGGIILFVSVATMLMWPLLEVVRWRIKKMQAPLISERLA